jgi:hypothetical protein
MLRYTICLLFFLFIVWSSKAQTTKGGGLTLRKTYESVFSPVTPHPVPVRKIINAPPQPKSYTRFEGKVIRAIHISTYDPGGYDTRDTSVTPHGFFSDLENDLHAKTKIRTIRNMLIIKKHDRFDSLRVKESERLIRSQDFVREVFVAPVLKRDSVDIYIRVYDVWSFIIAEEPTLLGFTIAVKDENVLGTGHQFQNSLDHDNTTGKNSYSSDYYIPNIAGTYVNSTLHYNSDENKNYFESCSINRPFYSALTKWAGGISFQQQLNHERLNDFDSTHVIQNFKSNTQDYWLGKSWAVSKGQSEEERSTRVITSARYLRIHYTDRVDEHFDVLHLHQNEEFYLAGIGLSRRQYKLDNYIFNYGYTENVPVGRAYSLVGGYQLKDNLPRWYIGSRVYMANYHKWGYFNLYFEYGTFLNHSKFEEESFSTGVIYFSNIVKAGHWKLRQFIKPQIIIGRNRLASDNLSLDNTAGIQGFNGIGLTGTQKVIFTFQLQSYAPWYPFGFRFGPYLVCSLGMLGTQKSGFSHSAIYSSFGIGMLIKNEYLVLSTFQISIAYYPVIPGIKNNAIKLDPIKTTDFGLKDFDISEPSQATYQ